MEAFERLKLIRERLGFDAPEFAARLGYSNAGSYRNIESGIDPVSKILQKRLLNTFNVNPDYLLNEQGDMFLTIENPNIDSNTITHLIDAKMTAYQLYELARANQEGLLRAQTGFLKDQEGLIKNQEGLLQIQELIIMLAKGIDLEYQGTA